MSTPRIFADRRPALLGLASFALAGVLLTPQLADAGKGRGARLDRVCEKISCSDQQREDIERIFEQMHLDIKVDREGIRELRKQIADEWREDEPDERKLAKLADKLAAHERNIADRRLEAMLELHAILTPDQRELIADHLMKGKSKKDKAKKDKAKRGD